MKRNDGFSSEEDISASGTWDSSASISNVELSRDVYKAKPSHTSTQAEENIKMFFASNPQQKVPMGSGSESDLETDASGSDDTSSNIDSMEEELQSHFAESTETLKSILEVNNNKGKNSAFKKNAIARETRSLKPLKEDFIEFVHYLKDDPSTDAFTASESYISGDRESTEMQFLNNGHSSGPSGMFSLKYSVFSAIAPVLFIKSYSSIFCTFCLCLID